MFRARMERGVKVVPWAMTEGWSGASWANAVAATRNKNNFFKNASMLDGKIIAPTPLLLSLKGFHAGRVRRQSKQQLNNAANFSRSKRRSARVVAYPYTIPRRRSP